MRRAFFRATTATERRRTDDHRPFQLCKHPTIRRRPPSIVWPTAHTSARERASRLKTKAKRHGMQIAYKSAVTTTFTRNFPALTQKQLDETGRRLNLPASNETELDRRRISAAILTSVVLAIPVAIEHVVMDMWPITVAIAATAALGLAMWWAIRRGADAKRCGEVALLGLFALILGGLAYTGGFRHAGGWLCVLPVAATVLLGRAVATRWTVFTALGAVAFYAADVAGWVTPRSDAQTHSGHILAGQVAAILVIAGLMHLFARAQRALHQAALDANRALEQQKDRLRLLALLDPLTALPNRHLFDRCLTRALECSGAAVVYIDLDGFKDVNDSHGHAAGDEMLRQVSARLERLVVGSTPALDELDGLYVGPLVSRRSGDEFTIMLPRLSRADVEMLLPRLRAIFARPFGLHGSPVRVRCSMGVAMLDQGESTESALLRSDAALYRAKRSHTGGDVAFFDEAEYASQRRARVLREGLRGAATRGELEVVYQPLHTVGGRLVGAEALLRWESPLLGSISPVEFIPIAEESGVIVDVGAWVLQQACHEAASWPGDVRVSVNVSAVQLDDPSFVQRVAKALASSGLPADRLELEVTESVAARDLSSMIDVLDALRELGVGLALDDFGTGYSSLGYLRKLPVERLKIDRSFVNTMLEDESDAAVVRAIIALAKALRLEVLAEGVETDAQRDALTRMGCDELQGWLLGRPAHASAMLRRAREAVGAECSGVRLSDPPVAMAN